MNGATLLNARFEILWLNNFSKTYHPAKEYIENFKKRKPKYRILIYSSLPVFTYSNRTFFVHVNRSIFNVDYELFMIPRVNVCVCTQVFLSFQSMLTRLRSNNGVMYMTRNSSINSYQFALEKKKVNYFPAVR